MSSPDACAPKIMLNADSSTLFPAPLSPDMTFRPGLKSTRWKPTSAKSWISIDFRNVLSLLSLTALHGEHSVRDRRLAVCRPLPERCLRKLHRCLSTAARPNDARSVRTARFDMLMTHVRLRAEPMLASGRIVTVCSSGSDAQGKAACRGTQTRSEYVRVSFTMACHV